MRYDYDLVVIGGGSGGLVAARLAHEFGAKVALIDKERLGGDCLFAGCVPSKTLIHIAKVAHQVRQYTMQNAPGTVLPPSDMARVAASIAGVIEQISHDEEIYVRGVDVRFGLPTFLNPHTLQLGEATLTSKSFIIATGSRPAVPELAGLLPGDYLTNQDVFSLDQLPSSLIVLGGGPIGCELGQAFARLGSQVTMLQRAARLLPSEEPAVSQAVREALEVDGVRVLLQAEPQQVTQVTGQHILTYTQAKNTATVSAAALLVAVGRSANIEHLGLDHAGVNTNAKGIIVDKKLRASAPHIYAIGDVIGGYHFTHVAAAQAGVAAPNALLPGFLGRSMRYDVVPWVTFTDPEAARVGQTEAQARQQYGADVRVQVFPIAGVDRAQTESATAGFIKLVLGKKDSILGAHIVGSRAGEMLAEMTLAMRHRLDINDLIATIHAYPTYATGIQQAAFEAYLTGADFARARRIVRRFLPRRIA